VPERERAGDRIGAIEFQGKLVAAGFAAPLGRTAAGDLRAIARNARELGFAELRTSPWRALYAPTADRHAADMLLRTAEACGFIADETDPLLRIDACPGAAGCRCTSLDTRAAARAIAPLLGALGCHSCHISGCSKGCARSQPADLVLVGTRDGFGLLRYDSAQGTPKAVVQPGRLGDLPDILAKL
jgi:precorrin-3B synthase